MEGRIRLLDFAGRPVTLPDGPEAWIQCGPECAESTEIRPQENLDAVLLLGLGPGRPEELPFTRCGRVFWLEEPRTLRRLNSTRPAGMLPEHWRKVGLPQALELASLCRVYAYRLNSRLAPQFWGAVLGRLASGRVERIGASARQSVKPGRETVLLPGTGRRLLHEELRQAFAGAGFDALEMPLWAGGKNAPALLAQWENILARQRPAMVFSVNGQGLDPEGDIFWLCRALGLPVAIWCVDNPWHLLSGLSLPWWKEAALFVTDASFIRPLLAAGARAARHLPLAAAPHMWREGRRAEFQYSPLFVGRSAFPEQERFFAAARVPRDMLDQAAQAGISGMADSPADGPQFHWWLDKLGLSPWPGPGVRRAGLGADVCSRLRRARWIAAALPSGLRLVGDDGWRALLRGVEILPLLDYYAGLPAWYSGSAVLNVTSLLLPHSLNQRHFDVWAAGGLLLTDATPGLELFPSELTRPIILDKPEDFAPRLADLGGSAESRQLRARWREVLREAHGYEHRVSTVCEALGLSPRRSGFTGA